MTKSVFGKVAFAAAALAAFATPAFADGLSDWQKQVFRQVASKQTYPRTAQMRGEEGTARVRVYVSASGAVERTELVAPSGSSALDREALALPAKAGTFPAPPGGATSVTMPLTWKLL